MFITFTKLNLCVRVACNFLISAFFVRILTFFFCIEEPKVLISGNDFYAFPRIDHNNKRMAWIEWSHPNMPWDKSELWVGYFSESG